MEEEDSQQLAKMEAEGMGGGYDNSDIDEEEEADVQEIRMRRRTMRNLVGKK